MWIFLTSLLFINIIICWRLSISKKWRRFAKLSFIPIYLVIFISPFIKQPILDILLLRIISFLLIFSGISLFLSGLLELKKYGITLKVIILREFRKYFNTNKINIPKRLVKSGPYALVRHPQMVGLFIFYLGYILFFGGIYSFFWIPLIIPTIYIFSSIEERDLEEEFGKEYIDYKKNVGMFLIKRRKILTEDIGQ
jgi:protein-S-isoprenylcysteine O-methyltransferase Ste14